MLYKAIYTLNMHATSNNMYARYSKIFTILISLLLEQRFSLASSPGPFPAFQCCTLKCGRRAWYATSHCIRHHFMNVGEVYRNHVNRLRYQYDTMVV